MLFWHAIKGATGLIIDGLHGTKSVATIKPEDFFRNPEKIGDVRLSQNEKIWGHS